MNSKIAVGVLIFLFGIINSLTSSRLVDAAPTDFLGTWVNVDQETRGLTALNIVLGAAGFEVQGFGQCHPTDCDWGFTALNFPDDTRGEAVWDFGFSETTLVIHLEGDQLAAETYTIFKDDSGRPNYRALYLMRRSQPDSGLTPGWYRNSRPSIIYEDNSGLRILWRKSYVYQYPGNVPLYWYAQVKYRNLGSQDLPFNCDGRTDPSLAKEHIANSGYVPADETFCSRNPNFTGFIKPGEAHYEWAIFHNVPSGGEVSLEWGPYGFSPLVDPWYQPLSNLSNVQLSAECPPELVTLGTCQPQCSNAKFVIPHEGTMGWPYMDNGQDVINTDGTIHRGIDIFGNAYDPVYAPYDGEVVAEDNVFRIRHPALGVDTYYGHVTTTLRRLTPVKQGEKVAELQPQGNNNTHLHFTITQTPPKDTNELIFRNSIDPSPYFNAQLNFFDDTRRFNSTVSGWCNTAPVGIIQGVVKTPDGKGVSDARVEIERTTQYRITDYWMGPNDNRNNTTWQNLNQGRYIFANAPVREVKITASKPGLGNGSVVVTVETSKTIEAPDIILKEQAVPAAPSDISVAMVSGGAGIGVKWTDNSDNEEGFDISYSPNPDINGVKHELVSPNQTFLSSDWGLKHDQNGLLLSGQTMCFQVSAYNAAGGSAPTPWGCITVP